jgi:hypothetical protein
MIVLRGEGNGCRATISEPQLFIANFHHFGRAMWH